MLVTKFDIIEGIYAFQLEEIETQLHSHPAIEIIFAETGNFTLNSENEVFKNLTFAIIDSNQRHALLAENCTLKVLMIEHLGDFLKTYFSTVSITIKDGFFLSKDQETYQNVIGELMNLITKTKPSISYDQRIIGILNHISQQEVKYDSMIGTLQEVAHLSESRLSHLFKKEVGISLKKYLVWDKLKKTIKQHLNEDEDLMMSLIRSGFYDQPHFSKAFKNMMGITPSKAYNSRTVQVLRNSTP